MKYPYVPQALGMKPLPTGITQTIFGTLFLTDNSTVSYLTHFDEEILNLQLDKGYHPIFIKHLIGITGGTSYLCHNGMGVESFISGDKRKE